MDAFDWDVISLGSQTKAWSMNQKSYVEKDGTISVELQHSYIVNKNEAES